MTGAAETIRAALRSVHGTSFSEDGKTCPACIVEAEVDRLLARLEAAERERDEARDARDFLGDEHLKRAVLAEARLEAAEEALRKIADNAETWHGYLPPDNAPGAGHVRALGVIAKWARVALAAAAPTRKCPNCNGSGKVRDSMLVNPVTCGRCDGTGRLVAAAPGETTLTERGDPNICANCGQTP